MPARFGGSVRFYPRGGWIGLGKEGTRRQESRRNGGKKDHSIEEAPKMECTSIKERGKKMFKKRRHVWEAKFVRPFRIANGLPLGRGNRRPEKARREKTFVEREEGEIHHSNISQKKKTNICVSNGGRMKEDLLSIPNLRYLGGGGKGGLWLFRITVKKGLSRYERRGGKKERRRSV